MMLTASKSSKSNNTISSSSLKLINSKEIILPLHHYKDNTSSIYNKENKSIDYTNSSLLTSKLKECVLKSLKSNISNTADADGAGAAANSPDLNLDYELFLKNLNKKPFDVNNFIKTRMANAYHGKNAYLFFDLKSNKKRRFPLNKKNNLNQLSTENRLKRDPKLTRELNETRNKFNHNPKYKSSLSIYSRSKTSQPIFRTKTSKNSGIDQLINETKDLSINESESEQNQVIYMDTKIAWDHLKFGIVDIDLEYVRANDIKLQNYYEDSESVISLPNHNIPYKDDYNIQNDTRCYFCKESKQNEINYPCRICNRVYHAKCIEQKGLLRSEIDRKIMLQAFSNIGWSCPECSSLGNLIPQSDILELIEQFEFSDVNHDHGISGEEFLRMRQDEFYKQFGVEMSQDDIEVANLRFRLIDWEKSGYIDWDQYLNYECMKRLHKTPKRELVLKLTPKEIQRARDTFHAFDRDKGGTISEEEARRTYRHWFTLLHQNRSNESDIGIHVTVHSDLLMKSSSKKHGDLSWDDYIKEQAIYILVNRPNNPIGLIKDNQENNTPNSIQNLKPVLNKSKQIEKVEKLKSKKENLKRKTQKEKTVTVQKLQENFTINKLSPDQINENRIEPIKIENKKSKKFSKSKIINNLAEKKLIKFNFNKINRYKPLNVEKWLINK